MHESRCGVCCNSCEKKEEVHCAGCLSMEKPFWGGMCGVKSCCEKRQLDHCGLCAGFPCEMQQNMGKEQGYDPAPRLEQCRFWAQQD
ncbi:DUF3795 domain-containing protein [Christensenellaceae bacterium OttesenSCG-928-K19]|nr:DUF3795 domain-containing protein [Christensenellaceae bacterium OttesenSCG-928-K19]